MIFVSRVFVWVREPAGVAVVEIAKIAPSVGAENRICRGTDGSTINGPNYLTYKIL